MGTTLQHLQRICSTFSLRLRGVWRRKSLRPSKSAVSLRCPEESTLGWHGPARRWRRLQGKRPFWLSYKSQAAASMSAKDTSANKSCPELGSPSRAPAYWWLEPTRQQFCKETSPPPPPPPPPPPSLPLAATSPRSPVSSPRDSQVSSPRPPTSADNAELEPPGAVTSTDNAELEPPGAVTAPTSQMPGSDRGTTILHLAAQYPSAGPVRSLVRAQADVQAQDHSGVTALHVAALCGRCEVVEALIEAGAHLSAAAVDGSLPLHVAARCGNEDVLGMLLEARADLESKDLTGASPLHCAADGGHLAAVDALLDAGADCRARDAWWREPLHAAARGGSIGVANSLLLYGGDPSVEDAWGQTPMDVAVQSGHGAVAVELWKSHAGGRGQLLNACYRRDDHAVPAEAVLLAARADSSMDAPHFVHVPF